MLQSHVRTTGNECRQVPGIMSCAGSATEQDDTVVQYASIAILVALQFSEEIGQLLTEKFVVLGKLQLAILVIRMRQAVVRFLEPQLKWESIADSHAVLAVKHEGD